MSRSRTADAPVAVSTVPRRAALGAIGATLLAAATGASSRAAPAQAAARDAATPMEAGRPSVTAFGAAALRAAHQVLDAPPVFEDPLALRIVGPRAAAAIVDAPQRAGSPASLRALVSLRSRHAEQALADAVGRGVRQYVVLGAGLDTFAYRNPFAARGLRVFEVDHPATQRWKRARLAEAGIDVPASASFAPVDFERDTLADGLARAGFDADAPVFFSLLGVVVYLPRDAAMATLGWVARRAPGSAIAFDYGVVAERLDSAARAARDAMARRVAEAGEPWITHFDPPELRRSLHELGFGATEDLGGDALHARYAVEGRRAPSLSGAARMMVAGR